ncbi:MAG: aspartate ammonia-lyase [Candidatus Micrarchaeota archaeon]|nr:aspartate ammonia-lyase [Candidatus Micrarchaeota archaeon]MDE1847981.1 aspartate ammonia-lyase [Candidatus Micrarchaeota archaeon]MDE1864676.1 aspartate ammonia-lyase [Candidatus Micrarchaeota archaeon]
MASERVEEDSIGKVRVPHDAYYGSFTVRASQNFKISGIKPSAEFISAYSIIKKSAALANLRAGRLDKKIAGAIARACDEIASGKLYDQFIVDVFQAGAGTSTNMNLNEVLANRALELLGKKKGDYSVIHPNDHVNMSQSTNDTYPSCIRISSYLAMHSKLIPALARLHKSLDTKAKEFSGVVKLGRTHLQDAVPMTLGQEFSGYAASIAHEITRLESSAEGLLELPIGGTAIGSGINAPEKFADMAIAEIRKSTGKNFKKCESIFKAMQSRSEELETSSALRGVAVAVSKIANDLRLLGSGPRAGFGELILPEVQPGSSIMPGKINPSVPEMVNMVCFQVIGCDQAILQAAGSGQLEINVFMPLISYNLLFSIDILANAVSTLERLCIRGILANIKEISRHLEENLSLATALTPYIGYEKAVQVAKRAHSEGRSVKEICVEMRLFRKEELDRILDYRKLAGIK